MVVQLGKFTKKKNHWTEDLQWVNSMVCKSYYFKNYFKDLGEKNNFLNP